MEVEGRGCVVEGCEGVVSAASVWREEACEVCRRN